MTLAFLHGEILVGWFLTGALVIFAAACVGFWLWRYPPRAPILPAAIYLVIAIVGGFLWMTDPSNLLWSSIGFALTLPWSAVFLFAVMQCEVEPPAWLILPGIPLNALLVYLALRSRGRHRVPAATGDNKAL